MEELSVATCLSTIIMDGWIAYLKDMLGALLIEVTAANNPRRTHLLPPKNPAHRKLCPGSANLNGGRVRFRGFHLGGVVSTRWKYL